MEKERKKKQMDGRNSFLTFSNGIKTNHEDYLRGYNSLINTIYRSRGETLINLGKVYQDKVLDTYMELEEKYDIAYFADEFPIRQEYETRLINMMTEGVPGVKLIDKKTTKLNKLLSNSIIRKIISIKVMNRKMVGYFDEGIEKWNSVADSIRKYSYEDNFLDLMFGTIERLDPKICSIETLTNFYRAFYILSKKMNKLDEFKTAETDFANLFVKKNNEFKLYVISEYNKQMELTKKRDELKK